MTANSLSRTFLHGVGICCPSLSVSLIVTMVWHNNALLVFVFLFEAQKGLGVGWGGILPPNDKHTVWAKDTEGQSSSNDTAHASEAMH